MCRPVVDLFRHGVVGVPLLSCAHMPHSAILAKRGHPCTLCITSIILVNNLLVCTLFDSELATEITLAGLKRPFSFCSVDFGREYHTISEK